MIYTRVITAMFAAVLLRGVVHVASSPATLHEEVHKDMDNPFTGVWNVSYAPMTTVATRMGLR
jgi:hypothetical protein